jgi:hypothetical protein
MGPSYRIIFYVSGHGFGHTSRAIAVIDAVLRSQPEARVVVKTSAPRHLFAHILHDRCEFIQLQCDAGIVQIDSLNLDASASVRRAVEFQEGLPALAAAEAKYLRENAADLAVGDIPPIAAAAACAAGIPSILIGNFTWDWIYEAYPDRAAPELARDIRRVYRDATLALRLPMAGGFAGLEPITRDIPFIAHRSERTQDEVRDALGLPPRRSGKPLVLIAFGGHGIAGLDTSALAAQEEYSIATTDAPAADGANKPAPGLLYIAKQQLENNGLHFVDLVRGADVVVTKPGYGIISEAIANDAALLYTSRGEFVEYDVLVEEMPRYLRVRFIDQENLLSGNWKAALEHLLSQPPTPEKPALNGAEVAAKEILKLGRQNRM